eukprot:m.116292 g.116292  ORF g.116292 m.116292 type:complete len:309 (+) comp9499_c0_seq3:4422-5348(+)
MLQRSSAYTDVRKRLEVLNGVGKMPHAAEHVVKEKRIDHFAQLIKQAGNDGIHGVGRGTSICDKHVSQRAALQAADGGHSKRRASLHDGRVARRRCVDAGCSCGDMLALEANALHSRVEPAAPSTRLCSCRRLRSKGRRLNHRVHHIHDLLYKALHCGTVTTVLDTVKMRIDRLGKLIPECKCMVVKLFHLRIIAVALSTFGLRHQAHPLQNGSDRLVKKAHLGGIHFALRLETLQAALEQLNASKRIVLLQRGKKFELLLCKLNNVVTVLAKAGTLLFCLDALHRYLGIVLQRGERCLDASVGTVRF